MQRVGTRESHWHGEVAAFDQIQDAGFARHQFGVVAGRERQCERASSDAVEIDGDLQRFLFLLFVLGCGGRSFFLLLVAFRSERRGQILAQHQHVYRAADGTVEAPHGAFHHRTDVDARGEEQVLAAGVEDRIAREAHAVGGLMHLAGFQRIQVHRAHMAGQELGVDQPAAIGRPLRRGHRIGRLEHVFVDFHRRLLFQIDVPVAQRLVDVGDLLRIRRPLHPAIERRCAQIELAHLARAVVRTHVQFVIARFIREVGDPLAVGRPGRVALGRAGGLGQIARIAFFRGNREDLAASFKQRARAGGRERHVMDAGRCFHQAWTNLR